MCSSFAVCFKVLFTLWWREWQRVVHVLGLREDCTFFFYLYLFGEMHWVGGDNVGTFSVVEHNVEEEQW